MGLINIIANWYSIQKFLRSDKDYIADIQQQRLRRLLRHAVGNSEFYQDLYQGIDIETCSLQDLPTVTKAAMMDNYDRFVTDKRLKLHDIQNWLKDNQTSGKLYLGHFSPFLTSGSTGENALIIYPRKALEVIQAGLLANYPFQPTRSIYNHIRKIAGYLVGKKLRIAIITVPIGNIGPLFRRAPKLHRFFTEMKLLSVLDPIDQVVEALNKFQPDQLVSVTFFIAQLAQEQLAGRLQLAFSHPMACIVGAGEILAEHTQKLALKAWDMKIHDTYGTMECYHMATSCSMYGQLHQMSHLCIIEIVDRNCRPVPRGQYGEKILLTNLINDTQPIIRYEIEDVTGYADQSCQCGSPLATLLPLQGRTKEFLYFKHSHGGYVRFLPNILYTTLRNMHEIRQFQIVQTARNELTFIYVLQNNVLKIEQKLNHTLTKALSTRDLEDHVSLKFKQVASIPRDERSGKYRLIISLGPPEDLEPPRNN